MIKVVSNTNGSGDWIKVLGHSGSVLWEGHKPNVFDLTEILNIVSRDGCELIQTTDEEMEAM
jgi:hypothetical protein